MLFNWVTEVAALSNIGLTIRAQTISPRDAGRILYPTFCPRQDVDSVELATISTIDYRPTSDRREWDARGRNIPIKTPDLGKLEMVPIEDYFKIGEREMQKLNERTLGNQATMQAIIGADIPTRLDGLVLANERRKEVDFMTAWALNQITAMNPVTGLTVTVAFNFNAARYTTAGVAWGDPARNAYNDLRDWLLVATDLVGPIEGVMLRLATLNAIVADAPNLGSLLAGIPPTRAQVETRLQDELGTAFTFVVNEETHDIFTDGGTTTARVKSWPTGRVAAIPAGGVVGRMAHAPVVRAMEMSRQAPGAGIDIRGQTAYAETENGGRTYVQECQVNAMPNLNEQRIAVINAIT